MTRSFTSLDPREALQVAISIEKRNADLYHRFAEIFTEFGDEGSLDIGSVFWEMAVEERGHHELLKEKYAERYGDLECDLTENDLVEFIEVPKLEVGDFFATDFRSVPGRERALQVALEAEVSAQNYYAQLVDQTPEGPLRELYRELSQMEDGHVSYLSARLAQDTSSGHTLH